MIKKYCEILLNTERASCLHLQLKFLTSCDFGYEQRNAIKIIQWPHRF